MANYIIMTLPITIFLIYDMTAQLSNKNIDLINEQNETNYPYGVTYQNLYDSREELGSQRGYFRTKNNGEKLVWVLPDLYYGLNTDDLDPLIGEQVSEIDYITIHEPTFDPINTED